MISFSEKHAYKTCFAKGKTYVLNRLEYEKCPWKIFTGPLFYIHFLLHRGHNDRE